MQYDQFVLFREDFGIFLGECMGLGIHSFLDPAGQTCAAAFRTQRDVDEFLSEVPLEEKVKIRCVPIKTRDLQWATMAECVAAGLPAWAP